MAGKRKPVVAGNWKMFKSKEEAAALARGVAEQTASLESSVDIVLCPPFTALDTVTQVLAGKHVATGAQNMHWENEGAYTGEVAASMLVDAGCRFVILGHSERRSLFNETDAMVNKKAHAALAAGLIPIICVGETLDEHEADKTRQIITGQVAGSLDNIGAREMARIIVAYEPVWAIGTGRTATPEQAQRVHALIRGQLLALGGETAASATRILYGGSVKPANAVELFGRADIDGGLVGGAALEADSFAAIVKAAGK